MIRLIIFGSGSSGNCYALMDDKEILILDAGVRYNEVLKGIDYRISDVVGVFVTHSHSDHTLEVETWRKMGVPIFEPYKGGVQNIILGGFHIAAFPLPHDGVENRGIYIRHFNIGSLVYMTDMEYSPYTFKTQRINHMLIEANYDKNYVSDVESKRNHVLRGHCEIETTLGIIEANKTDALKNIVLCHLSNESANEVEFINKVSAIVSCPVHVARKGLEVELTKDDTCPF